MKALLEAVNLAKRYGEQTALQGLNLQVAPGEVFCLLGANGAGKSTTINLFLGFINPTSGQAKVNGVEVASNPGQARQSLGYIPEQVMLYPRLTGLENLEYFASLSSGAAYRRAELRELLQKVHLPSTAVDRHVSTYSKGMRQKVAIAIALAKKAAVLLLDEPTSGLDPKASNEFSALIGELSQQGVAILMATHDLFRAKESGHTLGIMKQGNLVQTLSASDVGHADLEQIYLQHMHE